MHARACACARQALAKLESSAKDTPIFIVDAFTAPGAAPCLTGKSLRRHLAIIPCACAQQARASFALASPECVPCRAAVAKLRRQPGGGLCAARRLRGRRRAH